jgi:hypothetical protein
MDQFLNAAGSGSGYLGLQDLAIKTKFKVSDTNTLKIDFHHFETQTSLDDGDSDTLRTNMAIMDSKTTGTISGDLGQELDIVLVHKYDANTKIVAGYGHYFTSSAFGPLNGGGGTAGSHSNDDQDWAFLMVDTKF